MLAVRVAMLAGSLGALVWMPAWVTTQRAHDARTLAVLRIGQRPEPVLVDSGAHRVYLGFEHSNSVVVLDDRTNRVERTIPVGKEVEDLAIDRSAGRLYAVNGKSNSVSAIDTRSLRVVQTLAVGVRPNAVAVDPTLHRLYVTNGKSKTVSILDTRSGATAATIVLDSATQGVAVDPATHRVFVGLYKPGEVVAFDGRTDRIIARLRVGTGTTHPFRLDAGHHRLYVVSAGKSHLSAIDTERLRVVRTIATGAHPEGVGIDPAHHRAFVSNEGDPGTDVNGGNTVSVLDLSTGRTLATVRVMLGPDGIDYDPNTSTIYVANETVSTISVVLAVGGLAHMTGSDFGKQRSGKVWYTHLHGRLFQRARAILGTCILSGSD